VDDGAVLDIDIVADPDRMNIAPYHGVEPDAAVITHFDIACQRGVIGQEAVSACLWFDSFY
jgi:hypothetical protein